MSAVIEVRGLTKRYNTHLAVDDVSFEVREGEIFGFLGPNGAGKTTTQRMLTGVLPPTEGRAMVLDRDMVTNPVAAKERIGVVPEVANPYMDMTGWQNMTFAGEVYGMRGPSIRARAEELLRQFRLWERRDDIAKRYSKGMKQRLILAMSLIHEPRVLFLDEPTAGLDVESRRMIHGQVKDFAAGGMTVFYTTHNIEEANVLCDRVGIICKGRLAALDTPEALKSTLAGSQSVEVAFRGAVELRELEALDEVTHGEKHGDKLRLFTPAPGDLIERLVGFAQERELKILSLNTLGPSLEEVFVTLSSEEPPGGHPDDGGRS
ncbi:MAG: ABC transporter ATP-binding protein [Armatimonadota bacterium]|jgi:ABC-2 type transport system ATP-binding protein